MKRFVGLLAAVVLLVVFTAPAGATWSIVGVDPDTGQVGVAIASCVPADAINTERGLDTVALVPGVGAGVTQALLIVEARDEIEKLLAENLSAADVIAGVIDPSFDEDSADRQNGVVLLNGETAGFTGERNSDVAYDRQGTNVSAQGNILVSRAVIDDAIVAFEADSSKPLGDRLIDALEAGSLAGGDSRCGDQTALFAHISVINENGTRANPNLTEMTIGVLQADDGDNPVELLAADYRGGSRFGETILGTPGVIQLLVVPLIAVGLAAPLVLLWRRRTS